ncbi:hypothetical protein K435DRAFT_970446 [Dendrothele bispora CBS 962.96]|uniref:Uncharacterized protein n=1 Tax=Dendrothele bispora (strain CBS 962.96) TaxID=1314807 RepID=A0A4S8LB48_DENBC|nr:hypothetical protein K435DRAFT_970446 [Dendrothele bispora CBS 962.96]
MTTSDGFLTSPWTERSFGDSTLESSQSFMTPPRTLSTPTYFETPTNFDLDMSLNCTPPLGEDPERDFIFCQTLFGKIPIDPITPMHLRQNTWPNINASALSSSPSPFSTDVLFFSSPFESNTNISHFPSDSIRHSDSLDNSISFPNICKSRGCQQKLRSRRCKTGLCANCCACARGCSYHRPKPSTTSSAPLAPKQVSSVVTDDTGRDKGHADKTVSRVLSPEETMRHKKHLELWQQKEEAAKKQREMAENQKKSVDLVLWSKNDSEPDRLHVYAIDTFPYLNIVKSITHFDQTGEGLLSHTTSRDFSLTKGEPLLLRRDEVSSSRLLGFDEYQMQGGQALQGKALKKVDNRKRVRTSDGVLKGSCDIAYGLDIRRQWMEYELQRAGEVHKDCNSFHDRKRARTSDGMLIGSREQGEYEGHSPGSPEPNLDFRKHVNQFRYTGPQRPQELSASSSTSSTLQMRRRELNAEGRVYTGDWKDGVAWPGGIRVIDMVTAFEYIEADKAAKKGHVAELIKYVFQGVLASILPRTYNKLSGFQILRTQPASLPMPMYSAIQVVEKRFRL